jgi:hypothetical protein
LQGNFLEQNNFQALLAAACEAMDQPKINLCKNSAMLIFGTGEGDTSYHFHMTPFSYDIIFN